MEKTIHQGRNVRRFREMMGLKQEALPLELGGRLEPTQNIAAGTKGAN